MSESTVESEEENDVSEQSNNGKRSQCNVTSKQNNKTKSAIYNEK